MMNVQHVCDECGTRFPTAGELRNHASANHQGHQTSGLLTDANASAIRGRMPFGPPGVEFCKELAGELGIHWITVANIASGQSYKRVKAYPPEHPLRLALNERNAARQRIRDKVKPAMRRELGEGQEWRCVYCFRDISKRSSIDHIVPLDQGGDSAMGNLQLVCLRCNQSKGAMSDVDYRVKINRIQQALHRREERAKSGGWSSYEASQRFYDCPCHHYGCYPDCTGCEMCEHNENSPPLRVVCPAGEFGFQDCPTEQECISVRECLSARRSKAITKLNGACQ